jgi:hypothetical protein
MAAVLGALLLALAPQVDCTNDLEVLRQGIAAWRRAPAADATELHALAERVCAVCNRCDARDIVRYYTALAPDALAQGLLDEQRFLELRGDVISAGKAGLSGDEWAVERERILLGLRDLAERAASRADFVPSAQASSLLARLLVQRLESGLDLTELEADALAAETRAALAAAHERFARAGQVTPRLEPWWTEARLAAWRGDLELAEDLFLDCLEQAERVRNDDYREYALRGLAALARERGDALAEEQHLAQIAAFHGPNESWALACDWAGRLLARDRPRAAVEFLERCPPGETQSTSARGEWHLLMGSARLRLGELAAARAELELLEGLGGGEAAALAVAHLAAAEGRAAEVERALAEPVEWTHFSAQGQAQARTLRGKLALERGDLPGALHELEAALALGESQARRVELQAGAHLGPGGGSIASGRAASVLGEWLGLEAVALYAEALWRSARAEEALRVVLETHARDLRGGADLVGNDPLRELRELAGLERPAWQLALEDVGAWVACADAGLLTWICGADTTLALYAWIDEQSGALAVDCAYVGRGREALVEAARRLREAVSGGQIDWFSRESQRAWSELVPASIAARLAQRLAAVGEPLGEARLLILAHGPLEGLPIERMPLATEAGPRALDEICASMILPGLPGARPAPALDARAWSRWSLLGAPRSKQGKPRLPGAEEELREIARTRPEARLHLAGEFDRLALEQAFREGGCLHLATHLLPECAGRRGGLAEMSLELDGERELCLRELAQLGGAFDLAVLATCESGGGTFVDGLGLHGLARALLQGGTRNVVATLWPVSDRAARAFAGAFHAQLRTGALPSIAAKRARAQLAADGVPLVDRAAFRFVGQD